MENNREVLKKKVLAAASENGISKIQDISIELSFVSTKMDVHDVTVDVPLQENSSVENSLVQISNNTNDYAHKMYYFTNDKYLCVLPDWFCCREKSQTPFWYETMVDKRTQKVHNNC